MKIITEQQIRTIGDCLNNGETLGELETLYGVSQAEGIAITPEQTTKEYANVVRVWKRKGGDVKKDSPFGYAEEELLERFDYFLYGGHYHYGNAYVSWFTPMYTVVGRRSDGTRASFRYYWRGKRVRIIR